MWDEVLRKLAILKAYDPRFSTFGAENHRYVFKPPVPPEKVMEMEHKLRVTFPPELRTFYLEVGNGNVGPEWGMFAIENLEGYRLEEDWMGCGFYDLQDGSYEETMTGLLVLMDRFYSHESCMVMNGQDAGKVIAFSTNSFIYEENDSLTGVYNTWLDNEIGRFERIRGMIAAGDGIQEISQKMFDHNQTHPENTMVVVASLLDFPFSYHPEAIQARKMERTGDGGMRISIAEETRRMFDGKLDGYRSDMLERS